MKRFCRKQNIEIIETGIGELLAAAFYTETLAGECPAVHDLGC